MESIGEVTDLLRERGLEATGEEVLDLIWVHHVEMLADPAISSQPPVEPIQPVAKPPPDEIKSPATPPLTKPETVAPESPVGEVKPIARDDGDQDGETENESDLVYLSDEMLKGTATAPGSRVETLSGRSIPEPFVLAQALLPLRERRMETDRHSIDVDAMVDRFCRNGGTWEFVPLRKREPAHEIVLVLEQTPSVLFWESMAEELSGVFTDLLRVPCRLAYLRFEDGRPLVSRTREATGKSDRTLLQPGRRRLLLVLTDGTSLAWQHGAVGRALHRWAAIHPTTLILPFSQDLALRTELGSARIAHGRVNGFGLSEWAIRPKDASQHPVFLVTLDRLMLSAWTLAVRADRPGFVAAADLPRLWADDLISPAESGEKRQHSVDGVALLKQFRHTASRPTRELASVLAAVPLFPPVMRLVQEVFRQGSNHLQMAEFFYSGLIYRVTDNSNGNPDEVLYDFRPVRDGQRTIRQQLLDGSTYGEVDEILRVVGSFVGSRFGEEGRKFEALLVGGEGDELVHITEKLQPFAKIFGEVLQRTRRSAIGKRLEAAGVDLPPPPEVEKKPIPEPGTAGNPSPPPDIQNSTGMTLIGFAPDIFTMGSPYDEPGRDSDDMRLHPVTLTQPFHIAKTPVTQGQWMSVMGTTVEEQKAKGNDYGEITGKGDDHPMVFANWEDALRFCDKLTKRDLDEKKIAEGQAYTLPTEAQWEMACRAGTDGPYNVVGKELDELGWFSENSQSSLQPVGQKLANSRGLQDCHGNVWEWCADWFAPSNQIYPVTDPTGPESGESRVIRGGCWINPAGYCRAAYRLRGVPGSRYSHIGVRPVLTHSKQRAELIALEVEPQAVALPEPEVQPEVEQRSGPGGLTFRLIPKGTFTMGSPEGETGRSTDETQHQVDLTRDFWMAETPVTQKQWMEVMKVGNPSRFTESGGDAPVEKVSWEEAKAFCDRLNELMPAAELEYALPTEAEWEYACRAGTKGPFNVDEKELADLGWFTDNSESKTHPVKKKLPNAFGLFDMHGNVFEWCHDRYQENLGSEAVKDPTGPENGVLRVLRGGCWDYPAEYCRAAFRFRLVPGDRSIHIGFRPVQRSKQRAELPALEVEPEAVALPEPEVPPEVEQRSDPEPGPKPAPRSSEWIGADMTNSVGQEMLCLPVGTAFTMGSPKEEKGREPGSAKETPHEVTLTEYLWMAKTPITQKQWREVMGTTVAEQKAKGNSGGNVTGTGDEHPMYFVNWEEALRYCDALTESERKTGMIRADLAYTLPTEAQWEFGCRAGTTGPYAGESLDEMGWYDKNSGSTTHPVGQKPENPWGLRDMHGNVLEWCADWYQEDLGSAPATGSHRSGKW